MYGKYRIIKDDLYSVARRLREIDSGYFVVYCYKKRRFEVHSRFNCGTTYCLAVPYDRLDCRTIDLVQKTRVERAEKLLADMEKENERLNKAELGKIITHVL